jgi:hypothetical protein
MLSNTILTSWAGCPQSRLYHEVVAQGDRLAARELTRVARQWDHTLAPSWLVRLVPRRLQPGPFDPERYGYVVGGLSADSLGSTLEHVAWLRTQPCVRGSLRSVAFLEVFEAVMERELMVRRRVAAGAVGDAAGAVGAVGDAAGGMPVGAAAAQRLEPTSA